MLLVTVVFSLSAMISQTTFAKSSLTEEDEALFSQNNILFYEPCSTESGGGSSSEICGSNKNYAGTQVFTDAQMEAVRHHQPFYEKAAKEYGFPWEILAVLHLREHGLAQDNPSNGQGAYQLYSYTDGGKNGNSFYPAGKISDEEFQRQTNIAAKLVHDSYGSGLDLNSDDGVKKMFFRYNGTAPVYYERAKKMGFSDEEANRGEGSPYVMNRYDARRDPNSSQVDSNWVGKYTGDGSYDAGAKDQQWGAFTAYKALTCDGVGAANDSGSDDLDTPDTSDGNVSNDSDITGGAKAISDTAAQLAWPKGTDPSKYHTKEGSGRFPAYANAVEELGLSGHGHTYQPDCGDFVETVVKYSGYDENYGKTNSYIQKHPELWEFIEWDDGDTSKLRAGDIVYGKGRSSGTGQHWWIVTEVNGKLYRAEASLTNDNWGRITKAVSGKWKKYDHQWIYRAKGGGSSKPSCDANFEGSKNINATGAALAWPLGTDKEKYTLARGKVLESVLTSPGQTTEFPGTGSGNLEFQKAWVKANLWKQTSLFDGTQDGRYSWRYGAYCSGFTATVVRYSGYDKSFTSTASVGGYEQAKHAMEHSDLWDVTVWDGEKSSLQGGDILLSAEHSWMVVEDSTGELYVAEGSLHSFAFGHIVKYHKSYNSKTYRIRAKHANNSNAGVSVTDGVKTSSTTGTITSSVQNSQNIGAVARFFAWPEGTDPKTTIRGPKEPEVWKTLLKDNGFSNFSETAMGKDCGVFVGGVLRYSGLVTRIKHKNGQGKVPIVPSEVDEGENGWYRVDTDGTKESELQDGDVIFHYKGGKLSHFSIFLRGEKGEALTAQASHGDWYGRISKYHPYGQEVVYRNKNNKTGNVTSNGNECNLCPVEDNNGGNSGDGTIVEGGFKTKEEAQKVVDAYLDADLTKISGMGYACNGDLHRNCVNFSKWFIHKYLKGMSINFLGNGGDIADNFYNANKGKFPNLKESNVPVAYSIFSVRHAEGLSSSSEGHTGVILGINGNQVIFGEAAWCGTSGQIRTLPISNFTSGQYHKFIDVNAYINGGI